MLLCMYASHAGHIFVFSLIYWIFGFRPFLIHTFGFRQSKRAVFDWTFFDWNLAVFSSYRQSSRFYIFLLFFLEAVGVREYCCTAVPIGWQLWDSRAFSARNGSLNPRPSELVALGLAESRQRYVCGVALSREPPKLQQAQPLLAA